MTRFAHPLLPLLLISSSMAMSEARVVKVGSPSIHIGDSRKQIRSAIGEPMKVVEIQKTGEELWIYNAGKMTTTLTLENGHVIQVMQSFGNTPSPRSNLGAPSSTKWGDVTSD